MAAENYAAVGRLHMDLLVAALVCDLTRVATLLWGGRGRGFPCGHTLLRTRRFGVEPWTVSRLPQLDRPA